MGSAAPLLKLAGVSKDFIAAEGAPPVRVLRDIDLDLAAGESLAIVGPSGSGKSTLLNIIGTLDQPTSGTVTLDGQDVSRLDEVQTAGIRNREIGFIFQAHHLLPHCTVLENVLVPTLAAGRDAFHHVAESNGKTGTQWNASLPENPEDHARKLLARVGLGERLDHRPGQLSGGERQRVAVVRALINKPKLLLADEPTGALDRASADELARLLFELNKEQGVTLILVTHALDLARQMGRAVEIRDGTLKNS